MASNPRDTGRRRLPSHMHNLEVRQTMHKGQDRSSPPPLPPSQTPLIRGQEWKKNSSFFFFFVNHIVDSLLKQRFIEPLVLRVESIKCLGLLFCDGFP